MLIDAGYVVVGGLIATVVAWPIYQHPQALLVGVVGTLLGTLLALGGRLLRLPWWADAAAAVGAYLLVSVPLAIPGLFPARWLDGLRDAVLGVVLGWKQLVTLDMPLGDYQAVLVPLLVVTLFGAFAATRIAVSARRAVILAPIIVFAMSAFGVAFGTSQILASAPFRRLPPLPGLGYLMTAQVLIAAGVVLVVATVGWSALRARQERREALARAAGVAETQVRVHRGSAGALLRRGGLATGMLVVAILVAGAVAVPALQLDREVIRDSTRPLELVAPDASPLESYRQWVDDGRFEEELFTVEAGEGVDRLRFAVLDAFDGVRFQVGDSDGGARFARLPSTVGGGEAVRVEVADGYRQPWVPVPGDLASAASFPVPGDRAIALEDGTYYAVDGSAAIVLAPGAAGAAGAPGLVAGDALVIAGVPVADAREAIGAATGGPPRHGVDEDAFPELTAWLRSQGVAADGRGLLAAVDALRSRGYLSHALLDGEATAWFADARERAGDFEFKESRAGHSTARIEALFAQLLERQRQVLGASGAVPVGADAAALVAGVGDDEQFAAAGALLAWALGFDARVVVGVHLLETEAMRPPDGSAPAVEACAAVADGEYRCEGRHVGAWIEVRVGDRWVPLDTSPQFVRPPQENREGELPPPHGTQPERPVASLVDPPNAPPTEGDAGAAPSDPIEVLPPEAFPVLWVVGLSLGAAGLLVLPAIVLLATKALRRVRRRAGDPEASIVGAWEELVDDAVDLRQLDLTAGTRRAVAARLGAPAALRLAELADRAVFAERPPVEADRDGAWELLAEAREDFREGVAFWHRVGAALDPRSFARHLGSGPTMRPRAVRRGIRLAGEVR